MDTDKAAFRNQIFLVCLLFCISAIITVSCYGVATLGDSSSLQSVSMTAAPVPGATNTAIPSTPTTEIIPVTAIEGLEITACPDWDVNKMYAYGEYMYGFYCAGCHGRQGQGVPFSSHFPPLEGTTLAEGKDISYSLVYMMNTDIHRNAATFFEKDALAVINYVRLTFASNTDIICPGEYVIEINP